MVFIAASANFALCLVMVIAIGGVHSQEAMNRCNQASDGPGCFDTTCSVYICKAFPACCEVSWNSTCATLAREACRPEIVPFESSTNQTVSSSGRAACPNGFICDGNERMANCTELQLAAIELYNVGDIYGGIYCPKGSANFLNCPAGKYCPTPEVVLPCPEGYFCPHKSRDPDLFECNSCDEGAELLERDTYGYVIMALTLVLMGAYLIVVYLKMYQKELYDRLCELQQRQTDNLRTMLAKREEEDEKMLERIRPKLEIVSSRLEKISAENQTGSSSVVSNVPARNKSKLDFDTKAMFATLDVNGDERLSYEELNAVLELRTVELHEFVRRMNELDSETADEQFVGKATFIKHFLRVLEETTHFTITPEEAGDLFDDIALGRGASNSKVSGTPTTIRCDKLYMSSLSDYLTDSQINAIIKKFRNLTHHMESSGRHHESKRDDGSERSKMPKQKSIFGFVDPGAAFNTITRESFVEHYPLFLEQVTVNFEPSHMSHGLHEMTQEGQSGGVDPGVDICFEDLSLAVQVGDKSINVVDQVSGRVQAQTMTALMGGSGAGKTSLLNALCGRAYYGETKGTIHINGHKTSIEEIKDRVGFVPQDDVVYAELTVRENLVFSGKFRLPKGTPDRVISDLADETLASLGLSRVANSMVGDVHRRGVSGGEKKRVNIGLELMACPSILFLDEPTSGLDSSSALLVMQSLKNLVDGQGMTIVSVIHQPRKFIFDLFDSLILLGVGGKMVYHGPVSEAQPYFEDRQYNLPLGESIADWLIDISSGRMEPDEPDDEANDKSASDTERTGKSTQLVESNLASANDSRVVGDRGVTGGKQEQSIDAAKTRRAWLYEEWKNHYSTLGSKEREIYDVPEEYALPAGVEKSAFLSQLYYQITRALLVTYRNRTTKILDTTVVVGAMIIISLLEGVSLATRDIDPELDFDEAARPNYERIEQLFFQLFNYALVRHWGFALKTGLIIAVLIGLQATRIITSKRVEFFREAASGFDLNAYFLAVNIVATLEHSVQIVLASFFAIWIRNPFGSWLSYFIHFLALVWISVSWSLFFPQIIPPDNVVVVIGFFFAFCGLLLGGVFPPLTYKVIYGEGGFKELFAGWISPLRFFIEALTVGEHRCMPAQSGFTVAEDTWNFPRDKTALTLSGMAGHDINATLRSCSGWYWGVLPSFMVGLTIRFAAIGAMHAFNRGQQTKKPLLFEMKRNKSALYTFIGFWIILFALFAFTCWLMVREPKVDDSIKDATERQQLVRDQAECFLSGDCADPLSYFVEATDFGNFTLEEF